MKKKSKKIIAVLCILGLLLQMAPMRKVSANQMKPETTGTSSGETQDAAETTASASERETVPDVTGKQEAELMENTDFSLEDVPDELLDSTDVDLDEVTDIDDVDKLDLHSFTTVNDDNTKTLHVFDTPVKYYDEEENEIKFIDNSLERSKETDTNGGEYAFENSENSTKVYLPKNSREYVSIANHDDESLLFSPIGENEVAVKKRTFRFLGEEETVAEYADVFGEGYSLQYIPQSEGVKENIYIQENKGKYAFSFHVRAPGLKPDCKEGEEISFLDKESGEAVYTLGKLFIRDSYVGEPDDAGHLSFNNRYAIQEVDRDCYILTYMLDEEFLNCESTQYPVLVDPSISPNKNMYDAPVYSGKAGQNFSGNAYAEIGKVSQNFGVGYGFFQTKSMGKYIYINPKKITKATLRVYEGSGTTYASTIYAYDTKKKWRSSRITWNNKPAKNGKALGSCTIEKSGFYNFTITSSVRSWLADVLGEGGFSQRRGIVLVPQSSNQGRKDICTVNHGTVSKRPCINIQYKEDTSIGDGVYYLQNYNSKLNLTVNDKDVIQGAVTNTMKQQWAVKRYANGYYCLANRYYGTKGYLRADDGSEPLYADIWVNGTGDSIRYKIVKNNDGSGTYRILSKAGNDLKALSIEKGSKKIGVLSAFSGYTRDAKKKWVLKKVPEAYLKPDLAAKEIPNYVVTTLMQHPLTAVLWSPYENAPATDTLFQVFDSTDKLVYSNHVATAAIKGDTPKRISANWKPQKTGKYTLKVTVDSKNTCMESDESNNTYTKTINVVSGYKVQVKNYYDKGFAVRYGNNAVKNLKNITEYTKQFYRDMFGIMLVVPEPINIISQLDTCKQQGGIDTTTIEKKCGHNDGIHSEPDTVYNAFQKEYANETAVNKIVVYWTGHKTFCKEDENENERSFTYPEHKSIVMLGVSSNAEFIEMLLPVYVHELAHNFNAPDHYCYNYVEGMVEKCSNLDCIECYASEDRKKKCKNCIMMKMDESNFPIYSREHWNSIMCQYCKKTINDYLMQWCLPEKLI